jgi:hypothetical protein
MKEYLFHTFRMGDVEDPQIYAAQPIYEWQQTEQGQWVMEHSKDPSFRVNNDAYSWGYTVTISGPLEEKDAVYFKLKWGNTCLGY